MVNEHDGREAKAIPPFPWPRFCRALPIIWTVLLGLLVMNPGDEYAALGLGSLPAWPFVYLLMVLGTTAGLILGLAATTAAYWWLGTVLDRLRADPALFTRIWGLVVILILATGAWRLANGGSFLDRSSDVSLLFAAIQVGLAITMLISLVVAIVRSNRADQTRFRERRRRIRCRRLES